MNYNAYLQPLLKKNASIYVVATGGGAGIQQHLWDVPGISSVLVGGSFPYAPQATDEFLGFKPQRYCSAETAVDLASEAFVRAKGPGKRIGVGLTASVASNVAHRGEHRICIATVSEDNISVRMVEIPKGEGEHQRVVDGEICDRIGLNAILLATGCETIPNSFQTLKDLVMNDEAAKARALERFFEHPFFRSNGTREVAPVASTKKRCFFPGAFNPPHEGHFGIANAMNELGYHVIFSTTSDHAHKPSLSLTDLLLRQDMLRGHDRVFTKGDPLFIDKARRYPKSDIVIGADALIRMFDTRWCADPIALTNEFRDLETMFWVVDRKVDGVNLSLNKLIADGKVSASFPATTLNGCWDISSSQIRARLAI